MKSLNNLPLSLAPMYSAIGWGVTLTEAEQWVYDEAYNKLRDIEMGKAKDIHQNSRVKWAKEGDENTEFFHGMINKRKTCNNIPGLMIDDAWVFKPSDVKKHTLRFFKERFVEDMCIRPKLLCHDLKCLSDLEAAELVKPFDIKEIKVAVFYCGSDKAPGPDGFNFRFVKRFWDLFADAFLDIMRYFAEHGIISRGVGSSFVTLILKVKDPINLGEYRSMTLIGVISKMISKLLANRIKVVMGNITHETQSAFLSERYILDGPMIISEIFLWAKRHGKDLFFFKIDFEKAYDNFN